MPRKMNVTASAPALAPALACDHDALRAAAEPLLQKLAFAALLAATGICFGLTLVMAVLVVLMARLQRVVAALRAETRSAEEPNAFVVREKLLPAGKKVKGRLRSKGGSPSPDKARAEDEELDSL